MITKLTIRNFKTLNEVSLDLQSSVVFVGPNNSGKTSALQAIALWDLGMRKWAEARLGTRSRAKQRTGVAINRNHFFAAPVPALKFLWKDLNVRQSRSDRSGTQNVLIEIIAVGIHGDQQWELGFVFDYANSEAMYCRILEKPDFVTAIESLKIALNERVGYLPPMSGLASSEDKLERGSIQVRIGEGRTAEVLRNLCWDVFNKSEDKWNNLTQKIDDYFGVKLDEPIFDVTTGKIRLSYKELTNRDMDISIAGRGLQQILLLLTYMYSGDNTILLMDEPDAHLETLRQQEIYSFLSEKVKESDNQLIIATHSEKLLAEASIQDEVVAFLGTPHIVNDQSQLAKSLNTIGFSDYLQAEQRGWILYLEGSTDLAHLKSYAKLFEHPVEGPLTKAFVKYVGNNIAEAKRHFWGLREAVTELKGIVLFDKMQNPLVSEGDLLITNWSRNEIENYLPLPDVMLRFVENENPNLFTYKNPELLKSIVKQFVPPIALKNRSDEYWMETKISDQFLDKVFRKYYTELGMPILMDKGKYFRLIAYAKPEEIDEEVRDKLDMIYETAKQANPKC